MDDITGKGRMGDMMMDGNMYYDPRTLLDRIIASEETEIPLYHELARGAPTDHLRRTIEYMAGEEREAVEKLRTLYNYFPPYSGTMPFGRNEASAKDSSPHHTWLDGVRRARDMEIRQCYMLCHLALYAPHPHVTRIILELSMHELQQAFFWNDILTSYMGISMGYPGPYYPGVGYTGPVYPGTGYTGPGYGSIPGVHSQQGKKDIKE